VYKIHVISVRYTETLCTVFDAEIVEHYPAVRCLLPTDS
jgi:hypothetical protein